MAVEICTSSRSVATSGSPFSTTPLAGAPLGPTVTYFASSQLPSVSVFDYWSPVTAVQRILCGAGIDQMTINARAARAAATQNDRIITRTTIFTTIENYKHTL